MAQVVVDKITAAREQLELAIRLYFQRASEIAIHTLAAAAERVLFDLRSARESYTGPPSLLREFFLEYAIKPVCEKEALRYLNRAANFAKHADRDAAELLTFDPEYTEIMLFDACRLYFGLTGETAPEFKSFMFWFVGRHPAVFELPKEMLEAAERARVPLMGDMRELYAEAARVSAAGRARDAER